MGFPTVYFPGYPPEARMTEMAYPCRYESETESNRRSTQAWRETKVRQD